MKNGIKGRDIFGVTVPVDRDRKLRTALRTNQIAGFVTVPSEKKMSTDICPWTLSVPQSSQFSHLEVDDVRGQISILVFAPNWGDCLHSAVW